MMNNKKIIIFCTIFQFFSVVALVENELTEAAVTPTNLNVNNSIQNSINYTPQYYVKGKQSDCQDDCLVCCGALILFFTKFNISISM